MRGISSLVSCGLKRVWRGADIAASDHAQQQHHRSYPAKAEYPVRRSFSIPSQQALEYWIIRFRG
jgi:hypothetical protein